MCFPFLHGIYIIFEECDWVACLRPPEPPQGKNLRLTGWFGETVPFDGEARYVCERGMQFEEDPAQEDVIYTCQV